MNRTSPILPAAALSFVSAFAAAQDPVDLARAMRSHGVTITEVGLRGAGPDYSARFTAGAVEFTPLLGRTAERPYPVRFAFAEVRRGARVVATANGSAEPAVAGDRVSYAHDGVTEVYDVRADGIEQSFVFATKPEGNGDLVVRGAITTDLPLGAASDDGVHYELPGTGGVTFGAVTGVDANGATARGSIRVASDGASVEWVLPAAFVDGAAYPLVLDPLIGSAFAVGDGLVGTDEQPQVAFDAATGRYLVVWSVVVSSTLAEVRGQFVSSAGAVIGGQLLIASSAATMPPSVANVANTGRFLVVSKSFSTAGNLQLRSVDAGTASMSSALTFAAMTVPGFTVRQARLGGDRRTSIVAGQYDEALLVYSAGSGLQFDTVARPVEVGANGALVVGTVGYVSSLVSSGIDFGLSQDGGTAGRWMLVRERPVGVGTSAKAVALDQTANFCAAVDMPQAAASELAVATRDGTEFAVAWSLSGRVSICPITWSGTCGAATLTPGTPVDPFSAGVVGRPAIAFARDKYVVAVEHRATAGGLARVRMLALDPVTCATCGIEVGAELAFPGTEQFTPALGSRYGGGDTTNDEALLVWSDGTIRARRCEATGSDVVTAMGGGCSLSGFDDFATYDGDAVIGNANFQLSIANSVSLPLILVLGFGNLSAPCGSCTIVPTLDILLPATNPFTLSMPCDPLLVGQSLYTQWVLLKPSDCPILPDLAFTNALRFTIGE